MPYTKKIVDEQVCVCVDGEKIFILLRMLRYKNENFEFLARLLMAML